MFQRKTVTEIPAPPSLPYAPSRHPDRLRRIPKMIPSTINPGGARAIAYPPATAEEIAHVKAFFQRFGMCV